MQEAKLEERAHKQFLTFCISFRSSAKFTYAIVQMKGKSPLPRQNFTSMNKTNQVNLRRRKGVANTK